MLRNIRTLVISAQGYWFDLSRGVKTSGYATLGSLTLTGREKSGFDYLPTRPARAREALRNLPIKDLSDYAFIDLGCGRGRVLLVAAEFPFHCIVGVEFAVELHSQALQNIARCRSVRRRCERIQAINADVVDYRFPPQNLVVYLFNPFGPDVLEKVMSNLRASLDERPRHLVLVMVMPESAGVISRLEWLSCYKKTPHYHIYQSAV
jgi:SAM-dependent methyltransferase